MTTTATPELICDGGIPLWPVRWNPWRHGTWYYKVTLVYDGHWLQAHALPLPINGREYRRRQRARKRR